MENETSEVVIKSPIEALLDEPLPEIVCPIDGRVIDDNDVDDLAGALKELRQYEEHLRLYKSYIVRSLIKKAPVSEATKTTRVRGNRYRVKIERQNDTFNQSILKELWASQPKLAAEYLRVAELAVNLKEYKQLKNTNGPAEFEDFKAELMSACRGQTSMPTVSVEDDMEAE